MALSRDGWVWCSVTEFGGELFDVGVLQSGAPSFCKTPSPNLSQESHAAGVLAR